MLKHLSPTPIFFIPTSLLCRLLMLTGLFFWSVLETSPVIQAAQPEEVMIEPGLESDDADMRMDEDLTDEAATSEDDADDDQTMPKEDPDSQPGAIVPLPKEGEQPATGISDNKTDSKNPGKPAPPKTPTFADLKPEGIIQEELLTKLIQELDENEQNLAQLDNIAYKKVDRQGTLFVKLTTPSLFVFYHGDQDKTRIFSADLIVANLTDKLVEFPINTIKLDEGGKSLSIRSIPQNLTKYTVQNGNSGQTLKEFKPDTILKIPPRGLAKVWLVYYDLDVGSHIPKLQMEIPFENQQVSIDINRDQRGMLKLHADKIGPENCLLSIKIDGEMNNINIGTLLESLEDAAAKGTTRAVIEWTENAKKLDNYCLNWIRQALDQHYNPTDWFTDQYPTFPSAIRELHLVFSNKNKNFDHLRPNNFNEKTMSYVHTHEIDACCAAMRSAILLLSHDSLLTLLESNQACSKAAVMAFASDKLGVQDLDLIIPCTKDTSERVVQAALSALGEIDHPDAKAILITGINDSKDWYGQAAVRALANSHIPAYRQALLEIHSTSSTEIKQRIAKVIYQNPQPDWYPIFSQQLESGPVDLRLLSLKALQKLPPEKSIPILSRYLYDPEQKVWDEVLGFMLKKGGPSNEKLALNRTIELIKTDVLTSNMIEVVSQTRDDQAEKLMFEFWKKNPNYKNTRLIKQLLGSDEKEYMDAINAKYNEFSELSKIQYLKNYPHPSNKEDQYWANWKDALLSQQKNHQLRNTATEVFRRQPNDLMMMEIIRALHNPEIDRNSVSHFCQALQNYSTPEVCQALRDFRDHPPQEEYATIASNSLQNIYQNSSIYYLIYNARNNIKSGKYALALKQMNIAIETDPEIPDYYLERAQVYRYTNQIDKAITDYHQVIKFDPLNKNAHIDLADVLIENRRFAEAVKSLDTAIEISPQEVSLWTSRGHAYAMQEMFVESFSNYKKALEIEPDNSQAITGVALAETVMGKYEDAVKRIKDSQAKFPDDNLFTYNSACVYSRAIEYLTKHEEIKDRDTKIADYKKLGLASLKDSVRLGFTNADWITQDPDLVFVSKDPEFKTIVEYARTEDKKKTAENKKKQKENTEDE